MDIDTERVGNYIIRVVLDEEPPNPRDMDSNANIVAYHSHYNLPNDVDFPRGYFEYLMWEEIAQSLISEYSARVILPMLMRGDTYSTCDFSDPWPNSQIGFIFATEAQIREWHGLDAYESITPEIESIVRDGLRAEVAEYDAWARGDCYGYIIETATTTYKVEPSDNLMGSAHIVAIPPGEHVDSCWGFIGDSDYCMEEARSAVPDGSSRIEWATR